MLEGKGVKRQNVQNVLTNKVSLEILTLDV